MEVILDELRLRAQQFGDVFLGLQLDCEFTGRVAADVSTNAVFALNVQKLGADVPRPQRKTEDGDDAQASDENIHRRASSRLRTESFGLNVTELTVCARQHQLMRMRTSAVQIDHRYIGSGVRADSSHLIVTQRINVDSLASRLS